MSSNNHEKFSIPIQLERTQTELLSKGWHETAGPFIVLGQSRAKYIQLNQAEQEILDLRAAGALSIDHRFYRNDRVEI